MAQNGKNNNGQKKIDKEKMKKRSSEQVTSPKRLVHKKGPKTIIGHVQYVLDII